jgi:polyhydroxyalkanoate synthesis regulator phasin
MKKVAGSDVVTKDYLNETLDIRLSLFKDQIVDEVRDLISESNSKLYTRIDPLLTELEDRRLDRELTTEQISSLDKRVTALENNN